MLKIISSKDNSIWNLEIDILGLKFVVSNELEKYECYQLHFQQIDFTEKITNVFDFNEQQKIVNMITEPNPNLTIRHTWMKKNIYKTDENEILGFHIKDDEYQYAIYIEMKEVV